ncbi:MAG: TonB-dependent receptor [Bacteroidia bacterium]|nr:TonB-dependent receptor [Bacteroidia bacterium]
MTNELGAAVKEVVVNIKGTDVQVITDDNGNYTIDAHPDDILVFSVQGYESAEVSIDGNREVNVTLVLEDIFAISLDDLMNIPVASSSFFTLKSSETPGYIYSYNMRDNYTNHTLMDMARMVIPGVTDGAHPDTEVLGVRGMKSVDNSKTMVMYDGQNLNQRANLGYSLGYSSKLLGDVKTVEVCLGPNAIVHGAGAISGYINMVPKNGYDDAGFSANIEKEFEANAENQKSAVSLADISYGGGSKECNYFLYAGWYKNNGWKADSTFFIGGKKPMSIEKLEAYNVNETYKANIRLSANVNIKNTHVITGYMQNYRTSFNSSSDLQHGFQRMFNGKIKQNINLGETDIIDVQFATELTDLGRLTQTANFPDYYTAGGRESHYEGKVVYKTQRFKKNQLAVGALYGYRKMEAAKFFFGQDVDTLSDKTGTAYLFDIEKGDCKNKAEYIWASGMMPNGESKEFAIFAEDIFKLNDNFVFAAGLRFDLFRNPAFDDTQKHLSPRVAASWLINDNQVLKASYQAGFRTANYYDYGQTKFQKEGQINYRLRDHNAKFADDQHQYVNLTLKPEILNSIEINYHGDLFNKFLQIDANVFANFYRKTIDFLKFAEGVGSSYEKVVEVQVEVPIKDENGNVIGTEIKTQTKKEKNYLGYEYIATTTGAKIIDSETMRAFMYEFSGKKNSTFSSYANNGEDIKIFGGELIATVNPTINTKLKAIYSLAKSSSDSYSKTSQCPTHQFKAGLTQYLFNKALVLNANFAFEPAFEDNEENHTIYHDVYFDARTLLDVALAYQFKQVTFKVVANNVLGEVRPGITYKPDMNENYTAKTSIGKDERQYWFSVGIKF